MTVAGALTLVLLCADGEPYEPPPVHPFDAADTPDVPKPVEVEPAFRPHKLISVSAETGFFWLFGAVTGLTVDAGGQLARHFGLVARVQALWVPLVTFGFQYGGFCPMCAELTAGPQAVLVWPSVSVSLGVGASAFFNPYGLALGAAVSADVAHTFSSGLRLGFGVVQAFPLPYGHAAVSVGYAWR